MAKGRKPAIDGFARPQGILDDVVYPIVQKAARKVANKAMVGTSKKSYKIYSKATRLEDEAAVRRFKSYANKAYTGKTRKTRVLSAKKADAVYYGDSVRNAKKAEIYQNKANIAWLRAGGAKSDSEQKRMMKRVRKFSTKAEKRSAR